MKKISQLRVSLYILLSMSILVMFIGYLILQSACEHLVTGKDGYAISLHTRHKGNMPKNRNAQKGVSHKTVLDARTSYNVSHQNRMPDAYLSQDALIDDVNAQRSMVIFCPVMPFEDAVMEQWAHFQALSSDQQMACNISDPFALSHKMKIDITVQGVHICNQMKYRILHITETMKNGVKTNGGSGFMVRSYSHYLTVCSVIDHFNGTYNVLCPFYGPCTNISVILKHVHFSGFVGATRVIERNIWRQDNICTSFKNAQYGDVMTAFNPIGNWKTEDREFKDYLRTLPRPRGDLTGELGHWLQYKNRWRWIEMNGEVFPLDNNKTLCTCYEKFKQVHLVGASHQRYNAGCLSHLCQTNKTHNKRAHQLFAMNITNFLNKALTSIRNDSSNRYAFIIQFGAWDLIETAFHDVMMKSIPAFTRHIKDIYVSRRHQYPHVKVLVMSTPSLRDKTGSLLTRNNWVVAVFAKTLRQHMEAINIEFLDEFAFTFPLYTHCWSCPRTPDHHYGWWNGTTQTCTGEVGKAFMDLFTSRTCLS